MLILDTNTISYYFRNEACVVQQLQATPLQYLAVPAIVVYELQYGILRLAHEAAQPRLKALNKFLQFLSIIAVDETVAKIAAIKLCESYNRQFGVEYRSVMPTNLYGPHDNFHPDNSHVVPALIRRFHDAKLANSPEVVIWGTGEPMREFLHVDDMAQASLFVLDLPVDAYQANTQPMLSHINVGTGSDVTIRQLAETIADVTGYQGEIVFDTTKPNGAPRKLMDVSRLANMGWTASITLRDGLKNAYEWFLANQTDLRE